MNQDAKRVTTTSWNNTQFRLSAWTVKFNPKHDYYIILPPVRPYQCIYMKFYHLYEFSIWCSLRWGAGDSGNKLVSCQHPKLCSEMRQSAWTMNANPRYTVSAKRELSLWITGKKHWSLCGSFLNTATNCWHCTPSTWIAPSKQTKRQIPDLVLVDQDKMETHYCL